MRRPGSVPTQRITRSSAAKATRARTEGVRAPGSRLDRLLALEAAIAADRDDPNFDYAAH